MATALKSITEQAKEVHAHATQQKLAASDASHTLRAQHSATTLAADADREFRNMGQTLVPELLRELEEARRLLAQRPVVAATYPHREMADLREITTLAHENGWTVSRNAGELPKFIRNLIDTYRTKYVTRTAYDAVKQQNETQLNASKLIGEWCDKSPGLRYAEVSRGKVNTGFMVTLWQLDASAEDIKVGHGEGKTLEEALQRAQGIIIL